MVIKDVENLAALARIKIEEGEKAPFLGQMNSILDYIGQINKAVEGTDEHVVVMREFMSSQSTNVFRDDVVTNIGGQYHEDLIKLAPSHQDGYIKVKKILGGGSQ